MAVHLINPLWNRAGGSEWRTLSLYEALRPLADVRLWSQYDPDAELASRFPIRPIEPRALRFPRRGTFVFVGVYFDYGRWIYLTRPRRLIVVYNTFAPDRFERARRLLSFPTLPKLEIVYASQKLQDSSGWPGAVEPSPINITTFAPVRRTSDPGPQCIVGRHSRDVPEKHHPDDPALYRALAHEGFNVRIMGGACLRATLAGVPAVDLLPTSSQRPAHFLQGLDCFYYRTSERWVETFGRVVFEAMACGLPVVCHRAGGYAATIEHGRNGFLFDTKDEAMTILRRLRADVALRRQVGAAARATIEALFSPARSRTTAHFYLR